MPYRRQYRLLRSPGPTAEIETLDPVVDCQRIAHLLVSYEFPWDVHRALELALFHTYGSQSVSRLLDRTGEFRLRGQQRYDDTQLLIGAFIESGWDGEFGRRAIERMNEIHGCFVIPNDDFVFVLWTFIDFPIRWAEQFSWRAFTPNEERAWFAFWHGVGSRMGIRDIPETMAAYASFAARYEREQFVPNEASQRVAQATVAVMRGWLPRPLDNIVEPAARALISERLRTVFGYAPAPRGLRSVLRGTLKARGYITRYVPLSSYPFQLREQQTRTYGEMPEDPAMLGRPSRRSTAGAQANGLGTHGVSPA